MKTSTALRKIHGLRFNPDPIHLGQTAKKGIRFQGEKLDLYKHSPILCIMYNGQITIDGPAASGKSTVAKLVADKLDGFYINTGDMYRTLTWVVRECGIDPEANNVAVVALLDEIDIFYRLDDCGEPRLLLNGTAVRQSDIRSPEVACEVSEIAKISEVRDWMVERQRATSTLGLIVMEGRDIGTVVFPQAKYKFFLTASPRERARRRLDQAGETVSGSTLDSVAAEIARRDEIDSTREISPLRPAEDAEQIDSTEMLPDAVATHIVSFILDCEEEKEHA